MSRKLVHGPANEVALPQLGLCHSITSRLHPLATAHRRSSTSLPHPKLFLCSNISTSMPRHSLRSSTLFGTAHPRWSPTFAHLSRAME